jgi:hypothetical protein
LARAVIPAVVFSLVFFKNLVFGGSSAVAILIQQKMMFDSYTFAAARF